MPVAVVLNVTPVVSLAPGLAVALGVTSAAPRYLVTGIIVFFPLLVNSLVDSVRLTLKLSSTSPRSTPRFREVLVHLRVARQPCRSLFAAFRICTRCPSSARSSPSSRPRAAPPTVSARSSNWRCHRWTCRRSTPRSPVCRCSGSCSHWRWRSVNAGCCPGTPPGPPGLRVGSLRRRPGSIASRG